MQQVYSNWSFVWRTLREVRQELARSVVWKISDVLRSSSIAVLQFVSPSLRVAKEQTLYSERKLKKVSASRYDSLPVYGGHIVNLNRQYLPGWKSQKENASKFKQLCHPSHSGRVFTSKLAKLVRFLLLATNKLLVLIQKVLNNNFPSY